MPTDQLHKTLVYFHSLIDAHGVVQFSCLDKKDRTFGYAVEDQARALVLTLTRGDKKRSLFLLTRLLEYKAGHEILTIFDPVRHLWHSRGHSDEARAQFFWAICTFQKKYPNDTLASLITEIAPTLAQSPSPRGAAYSLLGFALNESLEPMYDSANRLVSWYEQTSTSNWHWFEDGLYYANGLFPWALSLAYERTKHQKYLEIAQVSLKFLLAETKIGETPIAIGNHFWYRHGAEKALYDEQPIDPAYTAIAAWKLFKITNDPLFEREAKLHFSWFSGNNLQKKSMIRADGGIYDGLTPAGVNLNCGAESSICYLLAAAQLDLLK